MERKPDETVRDSDERQDNPPGPSIFASDPRAAVALMLSEAELLRINAVTATAALPPMTSERILRDLSPLGRSEP